MKNIKKIIIILSIILVVAMIALIIILTITGKDKETENYIHAYEMVLYEELKSRFYKYK